VKPSSQWGKSTMVFLNDIEVVIGRVALVAAFIVAVASHLYHACSWYFPSEQQPDDPQMEKHRSDDARSSSETASSNK